MKRSISSPRHFEVNPSNNLPLSALMEPQIDDEESFRNGFPRNPRCALDSRTKSWASCVLKEEFDKFNQLYTVKWQDGAEAHVQGIFVFRLRRRVRDTLRVTSCELFHKKDACRRDTVFTLTPCRLRIVQRSQRSKSNVLLKKLEP